MLKTRKGLSRTKPMSKPEKPMNKESKKQKRKNAKYRKAVKLHVCEFCGRAPATERHHLYPMGTFPELATVAINLIGLCNECHREAHRNLERFRAIVGTVDPERMRELDVLASTVGKANQIRNIGRVA